MTDRHVVGVVVPAYNSEPWLGATIASLQTQTHQDWVCVIVDDGSTDGTGPLADTLAEDDDRVQVVHQPNGGLSHARNTGARALPPQARLLLFLDADDLLVPDALEALAGELDDRPEAVAAFGLAEYADEQGRPLLPGVHPANQRDRRISVGLRLRPLAPGADSTFDDLVVQGPCYPSAVLMLRRDRFEALGGYDEDIALREDWDYVIRASRSGPFAMVERQVAWYRRHGANLTSATLDGLVQHERVRRKTWLAPENSPAQRAVSTRANLRQRAAEVRRAGQVARRSAARRQWLAAAHAVGGLLWTASTLIRAMPPAPNKRRVAWTQGLADHHRWEL